MGPFVVSVSLQILEQLDPEIPGMEVHGANLSVARGLRRLLASPEVEALEVFLPPLEYGRQVEMRQVAEKVLPSWRRGRGALRFYPQNLLPEVWSDGIERIVLCLDPAFYPTQRYLRDRFAPGPTAISCQTHQMGLQLMYDALHRVAGRDPIEFDSIVCLSEACRDAMRHTFDGYLSPRGTPPPCRLDVIHHFVDTERFCPSNADERQRTRQILRLPVDGTLTMYFGRLTPNSKADLLPLLRVFASVSKSKDHLLIAGVENVSGYVARLKAEAELLGIGGRFHVRAPVEPWSSPLYFGAADIFAFPCDNVQECLPSVMLEAMASGLPSVVADFDGLRDLSIHGETGFLIPTYWNPALASIDALSPATPFMTNLLLAGQSAWVDTGAMKDGLRRLLGSAELRESMGSAARERVVSQFSAEAASHKLFTLWDELLAAAKKEPPTQQTKRRESANSLGLPIPFQRLFSGYATSTFDKGATWVRLSELGAKIADGAAQLGFYDETLPYIRQEVVDALFARLKVSGMSKLPMADLAANAAVDSGFPEETCLFHMGLLLKRDVLEVGPLLP